MADAGHLLDGGLRLATAALCAAAAWVVSRRPVDARDRHAMRMFALWWGGLAALEAIDAGIADAGLRWTYLRAPPLALALWGLLYYVAYLYAGRRAWLLPLGLFAGILGGVLVALDASGHAGGWTALLVAAPVLGAALAYASLYRRAGARAQRYRIALVGAAMGLWGIAAVAAGSEALRLAVPLAALAAYQPPARLRRWLDFGLPAETH